MKLHSLIKDRGKIGSSEELALNYLKKMNLHILWEIGSDLQEMKDLEIISELLLEH